MLAALAITGARASAQTRPLQSEEATTAAAGTLVLEVGVEAIRAEPNFLTRIARDRWDGPILRLVYSPADRVEMDAEWVTRTGARDDLEFGDVSDFGDVTLRAKVRLLGESGGRSAVGARFGVTLPQTSFGNGLGPNTLRTSAQLLASRALGESITVHLNAGLAILDEPLRAHEQRDMLAYGAAAVLRASTGVQLVAEVAGLMGDGAPGADERGEARAGVRLGSGRLRADVALRRGLVDATGRWGATAGLSLRPAPR